MADIPDDDVMRVVKVIDSESVRYLLEKGIDFVRQDFETVFPPDEQVYLCEMETWSGGRTTEWFSKVTLSLTDLVKEYEEQWCHSSTTTSAASDMLYQEDLLDEC